MDQTSAAVLDHHEHVEQSERGRHDEQEIAGNDALAYCPEARSQLVKLLRDDSSSAFRRVAGAV